MTPLVAVALATLACILVFINRHRKNEHISVVSIIAGSMSMGMALERILT
jgi:hypothetical protein